jgi:hypothetical protein
MEISAGGGTGKRARTYVTHKARIITLVLTGMCLIVVGVVVLITGIGKRLIEVGASDLLGASEIAEVYPVMNPKHVFVEQSSVQDNIQLPGFYIGADFGGYTNWRAGPSIGLLVPRNSIYREVKWSVGHHHYIWEMQSVAVFINKFRNLVGSQKIDDEISSNVFGWSSSGVHYAHRNENGLPVLKSVICSSDIEPCSLVNMEGFVAGLQSISRCIGSTLCSLGSFFVGKIHQKRNAGINSEGSQSPLLNSKLFRFAGALFIAMGYFVLGRGWKRVYYNRSERDCSIGEAVTLCGFLLIAFGVVFVFQF